MNANDNENYDGNIAVTNAVDRIENNWLEYFGNYIFVYLTSQRDCYTTNVMIIIFGVEY